MNRLAILNDLNEYALTGDDKRIIEDLNYLLLDYKSNLDLIFLIINSAQLYGFTRYIDFDLSLFSESDRVEMIMSQYKSKQFEYLNSGQLSLLKDIENYKKILIAAPTSFGKTSIVNEYLINNFEKCNKVMYVIPTNSLIEELYIKFLHFNKVYNLNYKISTNPIFFDERFLLILTPERFLMYCSNYDLNELDLIVMDETYKIEDENNNFLDVVNNRSVRFRRCLDYIASSSSKSIFLTPYTFVLSDSMNKFINKYDIKFIIREKEYVNHNLINIHKKNDFKKYFNVNECPYGAGDSIKEKVSALLLKLKDQQNIVYISSISDAYDIIDCYSTCGSNEMSREFKVFLHHLESNYSTDNLDTWPLITGLKKGIGLYISSIPRYIKKEIIKLYEKKEINNLIVTTSFVEGVNSNAENIIITSTTTAKSIKLTNLELMNIMGRAGRFGVKPIGNIFAIKNHIHSSLENARNSRIELVNYNYIKTNENCRDDYEIDMIAPEFLNNQELIKKNKVDRLQTTYFLTEQDMAVNLNVPKLWILLLYEYFSLNDLNRLNEYKDALNSLLDENAGKVSKSLELVFKTLYTVFKKINSIDIFITRQGEIPPFSKNGSFIWKNLYNIHSSFSMKRILENKKNYINKIVEEWKIDYGYIDREHLETMLSMHDDTNRWVVQYLDKNLHVMDSKIYNETFKFISDVMQYKIPFYVNLFASVFKLYINKEKKEIDVGNINPTKISSYFENGGITEVDQSIIDFGIPSDMIKLLSDNKVVISKNMEISNFTFFDDFQKNMIKDYVDLVL